MEKTNHSPGNPCIALEGYSVYDARNAILRHLSVKGWAVHANRIAVDDEEERVVLLHHADTITLAPRMLEPSGGFEAAVRIHHGNP